MQVNQETLPRPSFLILQSESVLLHFEKNTELPLVLETNEVCNCAALVIYSKQQGVAYLAHLDLAKLGLSILNYESYADLIAQMVKEYALNSSNTFVALVGAQDRTITHVKMMSNILRRYFTNIYQSTGGSNATERCIRLSSSGLEFIKIVFLKAEKIRSLNYEKIAFNNDVVHNSVSVEAPRPIRSGLKYFVDYIFGTRKAVSVVQSSPEATSIEEDKKVNLYQIKYQISGSENKKLSELIPLDLFMQLIADPKNNTHIQELLMVSLPERKNSFSRNLVKYSKDRMDYAFNACVSRLRDAFDLEEISNVVVSQPAYECAIHRLRLFENAKSSVGLIEAIKLSYIQLSCFRYKVLLPFIRNKQITISEIHCMGIFAESLLKHDYHLNFLMNEANNIPISKILSLLHPRSKMLKQTLSRLDELFLNEIVDTAQIMQLSIADVEDLYKTIKESKVTCDELPKVTKKDTLVSTESRNDSLEDPFEQPTYSEKECCIS